VQLKELGERKITELLIPAIVAGAGDDCCYFPLGDLDLVVTTDPVPIPAANAIAGDSDLYWTGRLLVTINASDLAAAGAVPAVFVVALECSPDLELAELDRFFKGVADGCLAEGLAYSGGNLKEAKGFAATGTAIGSVPTGEGLHRKGAGESDLLFSVGGGGEFWRDALRWRSGQRFGKETSKLFAPSSQLLPMRILRENVVINCSMDNSDGLLSTLDQLARINSRQIQLDLSRLRVPNSGLSPIEQARLWLGWGDWNVIVSVSPSEAANLHRVATKNRIDLHEIGKFCEGEPGVKLLHEKRSFTAPRLESERFADDSWFSAGIESYIQRLTSLNLTGV
jgi:thiamine-monophosphate kinase